jgi:hypothetical protein
MNAASHAATARTATATVANPTVLGKLRALAQYALSLHLENCALLAEAYRRPQ